MANHLSELWAITNPPFFMTYSMLSRWFLRRSSARRVRVPLLLGAVASCLISVSLSPAGAQEAFNQPDYSKFPVESGPITLEVWSWVGGLDKAARLFEEAYPNIKVHVNNVGGGAAEYQKLQTAIKAGSGGPDVAQIEYMFLPSFIVTDGLADLSKYGASDLKSFFVPWTWGQVSPDGRSLPTARLFTPSRKTRVQWPCSTTKRFSISTGSQCLRPGMSSPNRPRSWLRPVVAR